MTQAQSFPADFIWGCATAAYQIEGAAQTDGRGPSVWDTFSHSPGRVALDQNGDVAVDHYHRYEEDIRCLQWLGARGYRFSFSWPRVIPNGTGATNPLGLDFYDRLVDALLAAGIEPWPTLFHWDLPQALEDRGGWASRDTAQAFADYAGVIADRFSDRIQHYLTINEFACFTDSGYYDGVFAPGLRLPRARRNAIRHNALLAHGLAVRALRASARRPVKVGLAENPQPAVPVIETEEHIAAARKAMGEINAHFLTAVMEGRYRESYLTAEGADAPVFTDEEMAIIGTPLDLVGLNLYSPAHVRADDGPSGYAVVPHPSSYPRLDMPWLHINPQITYWGPRLVSELWNVKHVVITENGAASQDQLTPEGEVYDTDRLMYLRQHFLAAQRAVAEGWPLKGYFVWTLMDNFEWAYGFTKRLGVFYTRLDTLERIPKLSAKFYRETIRRGSVA